MCKYFFRLRLKSDSDWLHMASPFFGYLSLAKFNDHVMTHIEMAISACQHHKPSRQPKKASSKYMQRGPFLRTISYFLLPLGTTTAM